MAIEKVYTGIGQGSVLEQIDKLYRKGQRITLFKMLEKVDGKDIEDFPVILYRHFAQNGKKQPALLRFSLPLWKNHDEIFWHSLGDYIILAVHRVKDLEFDRVRGRLKLRYFAKIKGRIRYPDEITEIIRKIAYLVDTEALPHHRIHLLLVLFTYMSALLVSYEILTIDQIKQTFIGILSGGAIFATFGSALTSIGSLIERDLLERIKLNIDILYRDILKQEKHWKRWPFLPRDRRKKLYADIKQVARLRNPEIPLDVGTHSIHIESPTVLEDFFDLPLIKNVKNLLLFHKAANTTRIKKPKDKKNRDTGLSPSDELMAYECLRDTWLSVLKFRISRYLIHFGAALIMGSILIVSYNYICVFA